MVHALAVKYRILRTSIGGLADINDNLVAVGQTNIDIPGGFEYHAVFARVQPEAPVPVQVDFLEDLVEMPVGWAYLKGASRINNAGLVTGTFLRLDGSRAYFVCDVSGGAPPYPIQELAIPGTAYQPTGAGLMGLNESGDILLSFYSDDFGGAFRNAVAFRQTDGTYEFVYLPADMLNCLEMDGVGGSLNDATSNHSVQVVGSLALGEGVVYELTLINDVKAFVPIRTFSKESIHTAINDDQTVAYQGRYYYGDNGFYTAAAGYSVETGAAQPISAICGSIASNINSAGQITGFFSSKGAFIYDPFVNYSWRLDDLVRIDNPDDAALWFATTYRGIHGMSNALPGTGYPALVGAVSGTMGALPFVACRSYLKRPSTISDPADLKETLTGLVGSWQEWQRNFAWIDSGLVWLLPGGVSRWTNPRYSRLPWKSRLPKTWSGVWPRLVRKTRPIAHGFRRSNVNGASRSAGPRRSRFGLSVSNKRPVNSYC